MSNKPLTDAIEPPTPSDLEESCVKTMNANSLNWWSEWSDTLAFIAVLSGIGVAFLTGIGWFFSLKAGHLKDQARENDKKEFAKAIAKVTAETAEANREAAKANERAAQLSKDAATAQLELAKLQKSLAWRQITPEAREGFIRATKTYPKGTVAVAQVMGDPEVVSFTRQLLDLLSDAGYDAPPQTGKVQNFMSVGGAATNLSILVSDGKNQTAIGLQKALDLIGIEARGVLKPDQEEPILIQVGTKVVTPE